MIENIDRTTLVVGSAVGTFAIAGVTGEHIGLVVSLAAGVGAVVGGLAWIDARMQGKIDKHAEEDKALADARHEAMRQELRAALAELRADLLKTTGAHRMKVVE